MESTWFDMEGESIISIARQAMDSKMASLLPAPEASSSSSPTVPAFSSSVQQTKDPLAFKVKKRKSSVLDVVLIGDESKKSSKEVEAAAMAEKAGRISRQWHGTPRIRLACLGRAL